MNFDETMIRVGSASISGKQIRRKGRTGYAMVEQWSGTACFSIFSKFALGE